MKQLPMPPRKRKTRFPGIAQDAIDLGVARNHLYLVLTGQRKSPPLLARYKALKAQQPIEPALAEMAA